MNNATDNLTTAQHPTVRHEPWCCVEAHEMDLAVYDVTGCYGLPIGDPRSMGGWISKNPGEAARIVLDTRELGFRHEPLTLTEAAELISFLATALAQAGNR